MTFHYKEIGFFVIFNFMFITNLLCQLNKDIDVLGELKLTQPVEKLNFSSYHQETGSVKKIFTGMFIFYKKYISSQDFSSCPFNPSCSVYFINSVQKKGVIIGFLAGIDRYMRCNGKSNNRYEIESDSHRLHDPVDEH
jgi:uncharacterized protein